MSKQPWVKKPGSDAVYYIGADQSAAGKAALADLKALQSELETAVRVADDRLTRIEELAKALTNMVGAFDPQSEWWENEGLARHEADGSLSVEIRAEVLEEARTALKPECSICRRRHGREITHECE